MNILGFNFSALGIACPCIPFFEMFNIVATSSFIKRFGALSVGVLTKHHFIEA